MSPLNEAFCPKTHHICVLFQVFACFITHEWKRVPLHALPVGASSLNAHATTAACPGISQQPLWLERKGSLPGRCDVGSHSSCLFADSPPSEKINCKLEGGKNEKLPTTLLICVCVESILTTWAGARKPARAPYFNQMFKEGKKSLTRVSQSK